MPDVLQDLPLRQHAARVQQEEAEQRELGRGQLDERLAAAHLMAVLVEREVAEAQDVAGQLASRAPQDRLHARDDLGEAERLRHVVVSAGAQRLDLVLDGVLRREEEDRGAEAALAHAPADLDALDVGEHPIEHDEIGLELRDRRERAAAGRLLAHLETFVPKRSRDGVDDRRLVVDDEDLAARIRARVVHRSHLVTAACEAAVSAASEPVNRLRMPAAAFTALS